MPRRAPPPPAREGVRRVTSKQLNLSLTPDERALFDRLAESLGAPLKASLLAAARAALAAQEEGKIAAVRRELGTGLERGKSGPKVADDSDE